MRLGVVITAILVAFLARIFSPFLRTLFSPLASVPGPTAARFTDLWYLWRVKRGSFKLDSIGLHDKYGKQLHAREPRKSMHTRSARETYVDAL